MIQDTQMLIRATRAEKEEFVEAARLAGMSLSAWGRQQMRIGKQVEASNRAGYRRLEHNVAAAKEVKP